MGRSGRNRNILKNYLEEMYTKDINHLYVQCRLCEQQIHRSDIITHFRSKHYITYLKSKQFVETEVK